MTGAPLWNDLWRQTARSIGDRTEARWLCETASSAAGPEFLGILDEPATERMVRHLESMVARYRSGEPLQYVLGHWGFRRLDLAVDRRALIPRPETELLVEMALEHLRGTGTGRRVVDLGTGSGAVGLALADELPLDSVEVWLTDVDADALDVARANLAGIGRPAANVRIAEGTWFDALPAELRFDVIVGNPPYVAVGSSDLERSVADWEPGTALFAGPDGLRHIRLIVAGAGARLLPRGSLIIEIGADQGAAVTCLFRDVGFVDLDLRRDPAGRDRVVAGRLPG